MKYLKCKLCIILLGCMVLISCGKEKGPLEKPNEFDNTNNTEENSHKNEESDEKEQMKDKNLQKNQDDINTEEIFNITAEESPEPTLQEKVDKLQEEIDYSVPVEVQIDEESVEIPDIEVDLSEYFTDENEDHTIEIIPDEEMTENESDIDISE